MGIDSMMVAGKSPKGVGELLLTAESIDRLRRGFQIITGSELSIVQDPALLARAKANAAFQRLSEGTGRIVLGENPSWYEYLHEFLHYKHWKQGKEGYDALTGGQKELYVFEQLVRNCGVQSGTSYWSRLTIEERAHAIANIQKYWESHPREFSSDEVAQMKNLLREAKYHLRDAVR